jgi:hypothetical protein
MNDQQLILAMTEGYGTADFLVLLKGFLLGYFGVPLAHAQIPALMGMMEIYADWLEMGTLSRRNAVALFLSPLDKIPSFHNRSGCSQDYADSIGKYQLAVEALVGRLMEDDRYFEQAGRAYDPKQDILMSLNFT